MNKYHLIESSRRIKAYTDTLIGIFLLQLENPMSPKKFTIRKEICDHFKKQPFVQFEEIEKNKKYIAYNKVYHNITMPNHMIESKSEYDAFLKMFAIENYNNLLVDFKAKGNNILIDHSAEKIYEKIFYNKEKVKYERLTDFKYKLKTNIKIDENKIKEFDASHAFISLPTWRLENREDLTEMENVIGFIKKVTNYKNLILLSGDNFYKKYFCKMYNMKTTEFYNEEKTKVFMNYKKVLYKTKGNTEGLLKDYMYIQESKAPFLNFTALLEKHHYQFNPNPYTAKLKRLHAFDIGAMLVKENRLLSYET